MSITKYKGFAKQIESKSLVLVLYRSDLGATELTNSAIPKQQLETSELGQIEPLFGGTETARVSQRIKLGHTDLQFSVRPKNACAMA